MLRQDLAGSCRLSRLRDRPGRRWDGVPVSPWRGEMQKSAHNIFSRVKDSDRWFIVNPLSRQADLLDPETAEEYRTGTFSDPGAWAEKGYLVDVDEEKKRYMKGYLEWLDRRDSDEIQIFFVPSYACNFACTYCYQEGYDPHREVFREDVIDAFFRYVDSEFAGRKKYITIFGGEPLLPGEATRKTIAHILAEATKRNLDTAVVTNGFHLAEYLPLLKTARIREIQVTLDGVGEAHDIRRPLRGGGSSFETICGAVDSTLAANIPVNLRMVVDSENIGELPKLAAFAKARGWTAHPLFKTQLGRNYELHTCQKGNAKLYGRLELYSEIYSMIQDDPSILEFHRPAFSVAKFLWENGEMSEPLYDSCPGTKTEWAFDFTGSVYSCTATVGKTGEELGTFYPAVTKKQDIIDQWEERDVTTIPECAGCELRLACGGGCASVSKNKTGKILSPDCRPVTGLLEFGMGLYFPEGEARHV